MKKINKALLFTLIMDILIIVGGYTYTNGCYGIPFYLVYNRRTNED